MGQVLHGSAKTTHAVRAAMESGIHASDPPRHALAMLAP